MTGAAAEGLDALYPHLRARGADDDGPGVAAAADALRASVARKVQDSVAVKTAFFAANADDLIGMAQALAEIYRRGGRLFTMGNGGSSCDAAHLAVEFLHPITVGRPSLPAHQLGAELPMATAIGNDVGFDAVFSRQLDALARPGDALFGFSTSGGSKNLLTAYRKARSLGLVTFGLSGGDGGAMAATPGLVDHCLVVDTPSVHRVQEVHVAAYHVLWDLVHTLLADARTGSAGATASTSAPPPPMTPFPNEESR